MKLVIKLQSLSNQPVIRGQQTGAGRSNLDLDLYVRRHVSDSPTVSLVFFSPQNVQRVSDMNYVCCMYALPGGGRDLPFITQEMLN